MNAQIDLYVVLPLCTLAVGISAGFYLFMFLNIMRVDPREQEFRANASLTDTLLPKTKK